MGHCSKGGAEYHQNFDTQNREIFCATCHFEKEKNICLTLTPSKQSQKERKLVVLSTSRPLHNKTIDAGKEKPQIIKFYDLTKRWNGYSRAAKWLLYHQTKVLPLGYGSPIVYIGYSRSQWENRVVFEKWFSYFKHIFIWLQLELAKALALPRI